MKFRQGPGQSPNLSLASRCHRVIFVNTPHPACTHSSMLPLHLCLPPDVESNPRCPKKMQRLQPSIPAQVHHFTIAKFSHTRTLIDHVGPLNWNHVTGDGDLLCIFERIADPNQVSSGLIQKVLRGNDMLVRSPLLEPVTKLIRFDCCRSKSILSIRFDLQQCPPSSSRHPSHTLLSW